MSETTFIYGLLCPLDGKIHYVGKSDDPIQRLKAHLKEFRDWLRWMSLYGEDRPKAKYANNPKQHWLSELHRQSLEPTLVILEQPKKVELVSNRSLHPAERRWIDRLVTEGHPLTNEEKRLQDQATNDENILRQALALGQEMFPRV